MVLNRLTLRSNTLSIASKGLRSSLRSTTRYFSTKTSSSDSISTSNLELELDDTEFSDSAAAPTADIISSYDPVRSSIARGAKLPSSRYQFRSPRFYRGPLSPNQPPHPSNPAARDFIPGPFSLPRLSQTYDDILSHDLMLLYYQHIPFNTPKPPPKQRLRSWDDSSPYYKNRPLRGPRGMGRLDLQDKPINFRNIPKLEAITVNILVKEGANDSRFTHAAGMIIQAITTQRATVYNAKKSITKGQRITFTQKAGRPIAVGTTMTGEAMWHFMSTFASLVLPKIKDWKGLKARGGDRNGNFSIGLSPTIVELWPEVAVNYDSYPPQMVAGVNVTLTTSATNDQDGQKLLAALGIPFDPSGK